jgi:hypothetical protein
MTTFRRCQEEHRIRYRLGIVPSADAHALRFGSLVHAGLEAWWLGWHLAPGDRLAAALAALDVVAEPFDRAKAQAMLIGYDTMWSAAGPFDVLGVEVEFRAPLVNPETGGESRTWQLAGKLDAVVRDGQGRTLLVEHKTSSEDIGAGSPYWHKLALDSQLSAYYRGARALGWELDGVIYDVLGKPALRPLRKNKTRAADETPDEYRDRCIAAIGEQPSDYYQRLPVVRLERDLARFDRDLWDQAVAMRTAERLEAAPRNPDSCIRYGRACSYLGVCRGEASLDDPHLFRKLETLHPELAL